MIISNFYGAKNTEYSFITNSLVEIGYFIMSVQHDLKIDEPLSVTGSLLDLKKSF